MINTWKKTFFNKAVKTIIIFVIFLSLFTTAFSANREDGGVGSREKHVASSGLVLLEDFGGLTNNINKELKAGNSSTALAAYIDMIIKIAFGFGSILAVGLIVYQGIKYVTGESITAKLDSKNGLVRALGALAILFTSFILFNQLNPELLKVRFKPIVAKNTVEIDLAGLVFGNGENNDNEISSLSEQGYSSQGDTCSSDKSICELKRSLFIKRHTDEISSGKIKVKSECLKDTVLINEYCMYFGKSENIGENILTNKEYSDRKKEAERAGFGSNTGSSFHDPTKQSAQVQCDSTIGLNSYYKNCQCRKRSFSATDNAQWICTNFYKSTEQIGYELDSEKIKDGVGEFIVREGALIWNKDECGIARDNDPLSIKGKKCFLEADGRIEYGYFRKE